MTVVSECHSRLSDSLSFLTLSEQDCGLVVRPDQPCGLEPIPGTRSSEEAQASPRPCLSGDEPGRFIPGYDHGLIVKYLKFESKTCCKIYNSVFYMQDHKSNWSLSVLWTDYTFSAYISSCIKDNVGP